jgi:hypothetical protein
MTPNRQNPPWVMNRRTEVSPTRGDSGEELTRMARRDGYLALVRPLAQRLLYLSS